MSESMATHDADHSAQGGAAPAAGESAGVLLRRLRESAGVHIGALAAALKVPVAKLQALEADDQDAFPDVVFMRALASSVCRTLKVDAAPVLALLPQGRPAQLPPDRSINASFKDPVRRGGKGVSLEQPRSRLVGIAALVLLAAALAMAFLPLGAGDKSSEAEPAARPPQQVAPAQEAREPVDAAAGQPGPAAAQEAPAVPEPARAAAPADEAPAAQTPAPEGVLVIRARAESWVQVRNGAGRVVLQKAMAAGESYSAEGSPPWSVVVGKADATDVIVRGQPMDLKAIARENVARFEVK
ncbi:RodZ domain-containing protein [Alicycliphilus denitrificans]|uniref:Helix-turn-helix domain-containing protein n=1 Tax=Alicycliphilus denitrificans TaxID=179636 RepID=A0A420KAH4_9BURK|nr:RodZ domain-containing protein [Alicycliphilus denitrificans]RKJ96171.1 helix-turn-helix domain-containing protein [Alicycliphilus denitrificans]